MKTKKTKTKTETKHPTQKVKKSSIKANTQAKAKANQNQSKDTLFHQEDRKFYGVKPLVASLESQYQSALMGTDLLKPLGDLAIFELNFKEFPTSSVHGQFSATKHFAHSYHWTVVHLNPTTTMKFWDLQSTSLDHPFLIFFQQDCPLFQPPQPPSPSTRKILISMTAHPLFSSVIVKGKY